MVDFKGTASNRRVAGNLGGKVKLVPAIFFAVSSQPAPEAYDARLSTRHLA